MSESSVFQSEHLGAHAQELLPILPMIYIAWSDGILTPAEVNTICSKIQSQSWLSDEARELVSGWLDPGSPPAPGLVQSWLQAIRESAAQIPDCRRMSLADLGLKMAAVSAASTAGLSHDGPGRSGARQALEEIEQSLGVLSSEATRAMLSPARPEPQEQPTPSFDIDAMQKALDAPFHEVQQGVRTLLLDPSFRYPETLEKDEHRERVLGWCRELAARGYGALAMPKSCGGSDDMAAFLGTFEALAFHDLSLLVKYGVQFGLWGGSVQMLGTEKHHQKYLKDIGSLALPGCFAMTETGHGSNVRELETVARYVPEKGAFVLHTPRESARKDYIGNAACHGKVATVFAQLEVQGQSHGVHAFVVPIRQDDGTPCPGIFIEDCGEKMGLNGVDNGRIWFDQVEVPREQLLDRFGHVDENGEYHSDISSESKRFFSMLGTLVGGRVSVAAASNAVAKSGLAIAIRYGAKRRQFGPPDAPETPLLDYLAHRRRLFPLLAKTYALHFAIRHLQARYLARTEETMQEIEYLAAGIKSYASWHGSHTLQTCRECCGGQGFLSINRLGIMKADSDVFSTFEGDNTVLMQLVAKGLLSEFKNQFSEMKFFGLVGYIAKQAANAISERNPVTIRMTDESHLRDPQFHKDMLLNRKQDLLTSLAKRLQRRIKEGGDSFAAFLQCQDHIMSLAHAHIEWVILEQFQEAISASPSPELVEPLQKLCSLFALNCIEDDMGWFLENDYLVGSKARAIRKSVNAHLDELRDLAVPLVDSFAIPDELLGAPIATK